MHEVGLLAAAVSDITAATAGRPVATVVLALGSGVDTEAAAQAWQTAANGTSLAGAEVVWQRGSDVLACLDCSREYDGDRLTRCPSCSGNGLVVSAAAEIAIVDWAVAGN